MNWRERIVVDYHLRPGQPVVKGSHVEVAFILGKLADGVSVDEMVSRYPQLTAEDIRASLAFSKELVEAENFHHLLQPRDIPAKLQEKRDVLIAAAARHNAHDLRVITSTVAAANNGGELEFLVRAGPQTRSWFPAGLVGEFEDLLGCRVFVITEDALESPRKERVLKEAVPL